MSLLRSVGVALGPFQGLGSFVDHQTDRVDPVQILAAAVERLVDDVSLGCNLNKDLAVETL